MQQQGKKLLLTAIFVGALVIGIVETSKAIHRKKLLFPTPLNDLSTSEYERLKTAAKAPSTGSAKISVAIALSNNSSTRNSFYLSSNADDGLVFKLVFEDVPGTVITPQRNPEIVFLKPIYEHFTNSPPLNFSPGQYDVKVFAPSATTPLLERRFFLGGVENENYKKLLREAKLKE